MARLSKAEREHRALPPQFFDVIADPMELVRPYLAQAGVDDVEAKFYVYRVVEEGRKPDAFLFKCPPDAFDPEALGKTYGSGTYRLKVYVKDDDHPNGVIRAGGIFPVEMPEGYKPAPVASPNGGNGHGEPSAFERLMLEMIRTGQENTNKLLAEISKGRAEPTDPLKTLEGLKAVAEILKPAAPAAAAAPAGDFNTTLNAAKSLLEISQGLNGGDGGGGNADTMLLSRGMDFVSKLVDKAVEQKMNGGAPALNAPVLAAAAPAASAKPAAPLPEVEEDMMMLKRALRQACEAAAQGVPAAEYADDLFPWVPVDVLALMATAPDWFARVTAIYPEAVAQQPWIAQLKDELVKLGLEAGVLTRTPEGAILLADSKAGGASGAAT